MYNMKNCNNKIEFKNHQKIEADQLLGLRDMVRYVNQRSNFYRECFSKMKIRYDNIKSLADIKLLPITTKDQLQKHNKSFYCVAQKNIAEIVSTTGTTGDPVYIILTKQDLKRLALNEARSFGCTGVNYLDTFHIAVTLDNLFIAGMAYYLGITKLGASAYRVGMQNTIKHISLIKQLKPTGIITTPSFLIRLIECMKEERIKPKSLSIKKALLIGDSIKDRSFNLNGIGSLISNLWPIKLYSTYGNSETAISFCECKYQHGAHEHPDLIISEILDDNGYPVQDGAVGELVLTSLGVEGMPLLRYRTGDITFHIRDKCKCGRNSKRIGPILGRKSQMLKFKGTKLYPSSIENAIIHIKGVCNYAIEAFTGNDFSDRIKVIIGSCVKSNKLKQEVCEKIKANARVTPDVEILSVKEVEMIRTDNNRSRKPRIFIDHRKQHI
jgi:phenylacetate-CoA ligase